MANARRPSSSRTACAGQPAIRKVTSVAMRSRGVTSSRRRSPRGGRRCSRRQRCARSRIQREPDIHREPAAAPGEARDGRRVEARRLESPSVGLKRNGRSVPRRSNANKPATARSGSVAGARGDPQGAHPLGSEQPLLAGRWRRRRRRSHPPWDRDRSRRPAPRRWHECAAACATAGHRRDRQAAPVVHGTWRARRASWPLDRGGERRHRPLVVAAVADVGERDVDAPAMAHAMSGPRPPTCSWRRGDDPIARLPVERARAAMFIPSVVE